MKLHQSSKHLLLAAAAALGLATTALAGEGPDAAVPGAIRGDLLGRNYAGVTYDYHDLEGGAPSVARGYTFEANLPVREHVDFKLTHEYVEAKAFGLKVRNNTLFASGVVYGTPGSFGLPYVEAGAGWSWLGGAADDDSFAYRVGVGSEFGVAPSITVTPFLNFQRATGFNSSELRPGVKATYRFADNWGLQGKVEYVAARHDSDATEYSLGVNYRF